MNRRVLPRLVAFLLAVAIVPMLPAQTGIITTIAGNGTSGTAGVGGPAVNAQVVPGAIAIDSSDNLYIAESYRVLRVDASTGVLTLVAGTGTAGPSGDGGPATAATVNGVRGLAIDAAGNLYIAEFLGNRVRRVDGQTGIITD